MLILGEGGSKVRWIGIDEAGYGPNLGPLVMTAVVAEASCGRVEEGDPWRPAPDLWRDLAHAVDRAGGDPSRLWVDDSKRILTGGKGRDRLEATCLTLLDAVGLSVPVDPAALFGCLHAGDERETELARWRCEGESLGRWPDEEVLACIREAREGRALEPPSGGWRLVAVRSVVVGPECFNRRLDQLGGKARVHFAAFRELLRFAWELAADGTPTEVLGDKHGGRHYYLGPLYAAFPGVWIERGAEGPARSEYRLRAPGHAMSLSLAPRAEAVSGLVALASIVSKTLREVWMDRFNAYWTGRVEGLRPTAGYPLDAVRFRRAIEPLALAAGLALDLWWRRK
jgi:hypothetical protein